MGNVVIRVENVSKRYRLGQIGGGSLREDLHQWWSRKRGPSKGDATADEDPDDRLQRQHWALQDVSFDVRQGEVVGIIGRNGAGKSTLLKLLARITAPTSGTLKINGRVGSLLEVGTGFHPELTGRENIYLNGAILGMRKREIDGHLDEIIDFSELATFIDTPVKRYSSGMYVRLAFAVAAHLRSDILIIDEVLAVGDTSFQEKCLGKIGDVATSGRTVLFVSHNTGAVLQLCTTGVLLDHGQVKAHGNTQTVIDSYIFGREKAAERRWNVDDMPGDADLRLRRISVVQRGECRSVLNLEDPIDIEIETVALRQLREATVEVILSNSRGVEVLHSSSSFGDGDQSRVSGTQVARCRIPGGLLNCGRYSITVVADIPHVKFFFFERDVLTVSIDSTALTVSRHPPDAWKGTLSPMVVQWSIDDLPAAA